MGKVWVPRDYQVAMRSFALHNERVNWWAGTGVGKTTAFLDTFEMLRMFSVGDRALVVGTKRICTMVWPKAVNDWENFNHLTIAVAVGSPDQRLKALRANADITCINYENLPWLVSVMNGEWPWSIVCADESTRLKGLRISQQVSKKGNEFLKKSAGGSVRADAIAKVAHKHIRAWINMTGTPCSNGLMDLWGQQWLIDSGQRLGRTYTAFENRWFRYVYRNDDDRPVMLPYDHADAEIKGLLRDCTLTIEAKDYMDLPPLVKNVISVRLPPAAQKAYREMEKKFFLEWNDVEIEAFNAGSKSMKCRQIASGAVYHTPGDPAYESVHDAKIEALQDIIEEAAGAPILVSFYFKSSRDRILKAIPQARYFDDNPATLDAFCAGRIPVLLAHPKSAGHGVDGMQDVCNICVIFDPDWNLEEMEQLIERIGPTRQAQAGLNRPVFVHYLLAEDTLDAEIIERVETKASVQDSIKQAMKRRA